LASARTIHDFEIAFTADGSPSLRVKDESGYGERMHHSDGALSESLYIYGDAIEEVLREKWPLHGVSVGLGLGYNEIIFAGKAIHYGLSPNECRIYSFEVEPLLKENFLNWIIGADCAISELYGCIQDQLTPHFNAQAIRPWLKQAHENNTWQVRGDFLHESSDISEITCVLYDAFSNKMSPELWQESLLTDSLNRMCAANCVFSTYAATGALNRSLKNAGFIRENRPGFSGKRESTFARKKL
jgi:hypothetical protein